MKFRLVLERHAAMAGEKITVKLRMDILGPLWEKVEMKAEVVTALQTDVNRPTCITCPST